MTTTTQQTYRYRTVQERLDLIRIRESLPSDYKLALFLGIGETALANYRKGRSLPDVDAAVKISNALGENPSLFLIELEAQRAKTTGAKLAWSGALGLVAAALNFNRPPEARVGGGGKVDITSFSVTPGGDPERGRPGGAVDGLHIVSTPKRHDCMDRPLQRLVQILSGWIPTGQPLSAA